MKRIAGIVGLMAAGLVLAQQWGSLQARTNPAIPPQVMLEGAGLSVTVDCTAGRFAVTDARTGRVWCQDTTSEWKGLNAVIADDKRSVTLTLLEPKTSRAVRMTLSVGTDAPELSVELAGEGPLAKPLDLPLPFETRKGDRLIVPMNEGMSFPVDEDHEGLHRTIAYGGHGLCMGFFGVIEDATGAGWMCLLETADDAAMNVRNGANGLWQVGPSWEASLKQFGYLRKARYVFFDRGGHVAICKRYRAYAKQIGRWKSFTEKVKRNPNIDRLIGAANVWSFSADTNVAAQSFVANQSTRIIMRAAAFEANVRLATEMQAAGMDRILWSGCASPWTAAGARPEDIAAMNALPNVLAGRYDNYQDILDPKKFDEVCYRNANWVTDAFPRDINWAGPTNQLRQGWGIPRKAGEGYVHCAVICDACAVPYARKRIAEELKVLPYRARFIDTTVAAPWLECFNPDHPMTRSQSRQHKMELLNLVSGEFGLVCGSETGHDAAVPFCDYFEGMMSLGAYRIPEAGRNMNWVLDEVPQRVAKYQVGEAYRLPLWELVYHDCVVAYWYWGDYNNKMPSIWRKRDLFNALYGTPPMYLFSTEQWAELKDRLVASYKVAQPVARATGYAEMTDHRILTPDRHVQQTVFANGVTVTVNFGDTPYTPAAGRVIPPLDLRVSGL